MSEQPQVATESIAELLRSKRLEQKLSLEEVAERLKLTVARMEQLEKIRDLDGVTPFDRGHIRNYAALLKVDLSRFELPIKQAQNLSSELKSVEQQDLDFATPEMSKWVVTLVMVLVLLVVGYFIVMGLIDMTESQTIGLPEIRTEHLELTPSNPDLKPKDELPPAIQPLQD